MTELQCHISGGISPPKVDGHAVHSGRVYCDADRNLWIVDADLQNVFFFNKQDISHRQKEFEVHLGNSHTAPNSKPIYSCRKKDETVLTIMFSTFDCFRLTHILTTKGALCVFCSSEGDHGPALVEEWQLATQVTSAAMVQRSASLREVQFFAGCFDGVYGEVVVVSLTLDARAAPAAGLSALLDARGVFRIKGRLSQVLWRADGTGSLLVSVSCDGNIDVWDWELEQDVTQSFGGISWNVAAHGAPCDGAALLDESRLWLPTDKGIIVVVPFARGQTSPKAVLLDAHSGPVRQLLLVSGGRHVWSYAEGGRVSVWDADGVSFIGSFVFPDCRIADVACAEVRLVTQLWAVDAETGGLASLVVNESTHNFAGTLFMSSEAVRQARADRLTLGRLEAALGAVPLDVSAVGGHGRSTPVASPDEQDDRDAIGRKVEALVDVAQCYAAAAKALSLFFSEEDAGARYPRIQIDDDSMETMLTCLMAECRRAAAVEDDVRHFCSRASALMAEARDLTTLEDVLEALADWKEDLLGQKLRDEVDTARDSATPFKDVIAEMEKELHEKDLYTSELDKRIVELLSEQRELFVQLERAQQSLSDRDQQIAVLRRTAEAAKKAAALATADTAQLFELESCVHTAREKEKHLEAELVRLRARKDLYEHSEAHAESLQQQIALYEVKEKLAAHAIEDFISTQNSLFEEVTVLVDWLTAKDADANKAPALADRADNDTFVEQCRDRLLLLETHFSEKVSQQKQYFSLLRSEYESTIR